MITRLSTKKNYLKAKIKFHDAEVAAFYDKELPKVDFNHSSLAVISLDFIIKNGGSYYLQLSLKECKYIEKKIIRHIVYDLERFFDDSDDSYESDKR